MGSFAPGLVAEKKLPVVLSQQEVARLFEAVANIKHLSMLMLRPKLRTASSCGAARAASRAPCRGDV